MKLTVRLLLASALCLPAWSDALDKPLRLLRSPQRAQRVKALPILLEKTYETFGPARRAAVSAALISWLKTETDPGIRVRIADELGPWLSTEESPTASFEAAVPLLTNRQERVRSPLWLAFSQQASQPHLTPQIETQLIAWREHPDPGIRRAALNWMNEAVQGRETAVGQPESALGQTVFPLKLAATHADDPQVRNLSIYGVLQQYEHHADEALEVVREHLRDTHADTRSLVLDFLQGKAAGDARCFRLQPDLAARFHENPGTPDFPLVPDPELGPDARAAATEKLRVAMVLNAMGELPPEVWPFLASLPAQPWSLIDFPLRQGPAGRPLLGALLKRVPPAEWWNWNQALVERGAGPELAPGVIALIEPWIEREPPEDHPGHFNLAEMLLSLTTGEQPQAVPLALRMLNHPTPEVRYAAIYTLARLQPDSPQLMPALARVNPKEDTFGTPSLVGAVMLLRGRPDLPQVVVEHYTDNLLLASLQHRPTADDPPFLDDYSRRAPLATYANGPDREQVLAQLEWLAAHHARSAAPGVRALLHHPNPVLRKAAEATLQNL